MQAGTATVRAQGADLVLNSSQRTRVLPGNPPDETPLPPETNLIVNGDFSSTQPLSSTWDMTSTVDQPDEPLGMVTVVSGTNGYAALFQRTGIYHAETDLAQVVTQTDVDEKNHSYFQGFYAAPDLGGNPPSCSLCETHNAHIRIPQGVPWPFETGNLLTILSPKQIIAIKFYASGHSYQSSISNIELLAEK